MPPVTRSLLLVAALPLLGSCRGSLTDDLVVRGTFAGQHISGFEAYVFRPCGSADSGWLDGSVPGGSGTWARFKGYRLGPGGYGHLDGSDYLYVIEEMLATSPDSSGTICP